MRALELVFDNLTQRSNRSMKMARCSDDSLAAHEGAPEPNRASGLFSSSTALRRGDAEVFVAKLAGCGEVQEQRLESPLSAQERSELPHDSGEEKVSGRMSGSSEPSAAAVRSMAGRSD